MSGGSTETGYSEKTAELIDEEIRALVQEASRRALKVLTVNKKYLEAIKEALLEKETLDEKEILEIFKGTKLPKEVLLT
jgi:cell division protease FtsH